MKQDVIKNKIITFIWLGLIISILFFFYYFFFFKETSVDLTKNITVQYEGASGYALVEIKNVPSSYNQRIEEFYNSVSYSIKPNGNLKNGDVIEIEATYDRELARKYHIKIEGITKKIVVEGLNMRYQDNKEIPQAYVDDIVINSTAYLEKHIETILKEESLSFPTLTNISFQQATKVKEVFLRTEEGLNKDKFMNIYKIDVRGLDKEKKEIPAYIYYAIIYDDINSSMKVDTDNYYGEHINISTSDVTNDTQLREYLQRRYKKMYTIQIIERKHS